MKSITIYIKLLDNLTTMLEQPMTTDQNDNIKTCINLSSKFKIIEDHRKIADSQRETYNFQRLDLETHKSNIMIELDYKQKISIGLSPRQPNCEFYNQQIRTCLGK